MTENTEQEPVLVAAEPPPLPPSPVIKPKIRPELVISIVSLALSLTATFTNLFQTRLQREQQQTSVWPYVECNMAISSDGFSFTVANKGVGPAIITKESYRYENKDYPTMLDLVKTIAGDTLLNYSNFMTEPAINRVLSPQEKLLVFRVMNPRAAEMAVKNADKVQVTIEYQSIYGKRWVCHGQKTEAINE